MKKNIYCTIDTETIGGAVNPTGAYNYGGIIHDKQGKVYATFSFLVMEHYDKIRYQCKELLNDFEFIDIYLMVLQTVTHLKKYADFCAKHNKVTRSGKTYSTTAETVYGFISQRADYTEEHTAVSDALIEKEIFEYCVKMHKRYTKNCHAWDCKERNKYFPPIERK